MSRSYQVDYDHFHPKLTRSEENDLLFRGVGAARDATIDGISGCLVIDADRKVWFHEAGKVADLVHPE